jgi:REP-associated tyrosine transposase
MARQHHDYSANHLHYVTASCYRRVRIFDSDRFKLNFLQTLGQLREELGFQIHGYVLMPEHFHLLVLPPEHADPSDILQRLKERTALFILKNLKQNSEQPWCRKRLERFTLPASVQSHATYRVWQRRCYDMNIWSERKRLEKLNYMHANPVKRRLVLRPADWPWSSWRFYHLGDVSLLTMDRLP